MRIGIQLALVSSLVGLGASGLQAQSADTDNVTFEVASVKPNPSNGGPQNIQCCAGGRLTVTGIPLRQLIRIAYGSAAIQTPGQIVGGPGWIGSDLFDIVAKAKAN